MKQISTLYHMQQVGVLFYLIVGISFVMLTVSLFSNPPESNEIYAQMAGNTKEQIERIEKSHSPNPFYLVFKR